MKKSLNLVLIGILTVASLLLALPFTPLRTSFSATTLNYVDNTLMKMGVDFKGKIKNSGLSVKARQYKATGYDFIGSETFRTRTAVTTTNSDSYNTNPIGSPTYNVSKASKTETTASANGVGVGGFGLTTSSSGKKQKNNTPGIKDIGINPITNSLAINTVTGGSTAPRQKATNYSPSKVGTHPGLDPIGTLPVGDGLSIMLFMAICVTGYKYRRLSFS